MEARLAGRAESRRLGVRTRCLPILLALGALTSTARAESIETLLTRELRSLEPSRTGVLYDRVLSLSGIERFAGDESSARANRATWRQLYDELRRASDRPERRPTLATVDQRARELARTGAIPIAVLYDRYERIRPDALDRGDLQWSGDHLERGGGEPLEEAQAFAATALVEHTYRGHEVSFVLDPALVFAVATVGDFELDAGDGQGFRPVSSGNVVLAHYSETGPKTLRLRARSATGDVLEASFAFAVEALATPTPNDTLHVTATVPYQGATATGSAYVYLAAGRTALTKPVVVVEGFDFDNTLGWDELYARLNREDLLERLRALGYDAVVLDFADATDYIQRNAFVLTQLLDQMEAAIDPNTSVTVVGASMGGLVARYALAWLEAQGRPHRVRTLLCFDAPNRGANVPLGIQYWVQFFAGQAAEAKTVLDLLNRPAVRQMLIHHYTAPPTLGRADALKVAFNNELTALGRYPKQPRLVAVANGSGTGAGQGFAPGSQIIRWDYSTFLTRILGDVWALPFLTSHKIFDGVIQIVIPSRSTVTVSGTLPYDSAPGAWRNTMAEMDSVPAPYGDIQAFYPNHCFVPTISALDLNTDLFYAVATDTNRLTHTPFDAIYWADTNHEHVLVTPENARQMLAEITGIVVGVGSGTAASTLRLAPPWPSPAAGADVRIAFDLPRPSSATLRVFDVRGRLTRRLWEGNLQAGPHQALWDGRDETGRLAPAGIYFVRLQSGGEGRSASVVRLR